MNINIKTHLKYIDIDVSINDLSHDLGFHDITEARELHAQLQEAANELKDQIEFVESKFYSHNNHDTRTRRINH